MHIFKRLSALALALGLTGLLLPPARAAAAAGDQDAFYRRHAGECVMDEGSYYLNGERGYVTVCRSPQNAQAEDHLLNERLVDVYCVWTDENGACWGQLRYNSTGKGLAFCDELGGSCGWVRMSELARRYDRECFLADHLGEFTAEKAELNTADYESVGLWHFPGCGGRAEPVGWYMRPEGDAVLYFPAVWTDSRGRRWGSVRFERRSGFICLDEPGLNDSRLPEVETGHLAIPAADVSTLPLIDRGAAADIPGWVWPAGVAALAAVLAAALEIAEHRSRKER